MTSRLGVISLIWLVITNIRGINGVAGKEPLTLLCGSHLDSVLICCSLHHYSDIATTCLCDVLR